MRSRIFQRLQRVTTSFWFIPALLAAVASALAALLLRLDMTLTVASWIKSHPALFTGSEGARSLLATIAGSAISVAGVVFSITILVLNTAATQFGPGLISNFMRHRGTHVVLGAFVATFAYCLIVLRFVGGEEAFVPHIAANAGLLMGMTSFFLLIYFIHHVSVFIRVSRVIDDVALRMEETLRTAFPPRQDGTHAPEDETSDGHGDEDGAIVCVARSGYVQAIDYERLLALAVRHDVTLKLLHRAGHFVADGAPLARVDPAGQLDDALAGAIRSCMTFGPERSMEQDAEFAVHQLVEIALRALSPAVNDPFTAINCIDRLGAALALLASRQLPSRYAKDDRGTVRVVSNPLTYTGVVDAAFNPLRQSAREHPAVILRLLEVIAELAQRDAPDAFRRALRRQFDAIREGGARLPASMDREDYAARCREVERALDGASDTRRDG